MCIEAHDLALSNGREKDRDFTKAMIQQGLVKQEILEQRAELMPVSTFLKTVIKAAVVRDFKEASPTIKGPGL